MFKSLFLLLTLRHSRAWWSLNKISMWAIPFCLPMIGSEIWPVRWKVFTRSLWESSSLFPRASSNDSLSPPLDSVTLRCDTCLFSYQSEFRRGQSLQDPGGTKLNDQSSMVSLRLLHLWIFNYEMISLVFKKYVWVRGFFVCIKNHLTNTSNNFLNPKE